MTLKELSAFIGRILVKKKLTISVCESCTGGMLGSIITSIPGSSKYFLGGIIAYADEIKNKIVGVKSKTLKTFGAVSTEATQEMAKGVRKKFKTDLGIGITGIAGPSGGSVEKPAGLVYIGLAFKSKIYIKKFLFKGNRAMIRKKACIKTLGLLRSKLTEH